MINAAKSNKFSYFSVTQTGKIKLEIAKSKLELEIALFNGDCFATRPQAERYQRSRLN
jgi:hypothetical protein